MGVEENEVVDKLASEGLETVLPTRTISWDVAAYEMERTKKRERLQKSKTLEETPQTKADQRTSQEL